MVVLPVASYDLTQLKAFWPMELLQVPALGLVKSSFVLLYRRIFIKQTASIFDRSTWMVLAVIIMWTTSFFFALLFICGTDFSAYWIGTKVEKAHCVNTNSLHNAFVISDFITDFLIILLPLPIVYLLLQNFLTVLADLP